MCTASLPSSESTRPKADSRCVTPGRHNCRLICLKLRSGECAAGKAKCVCISGRRCRACGCGRREACTQGRPVRLAAAPAGLHRCCGHEGQLGCYSPGVYVLQPVGGAQDTWHQRRRWVDCRDMTGGSHTAEASVSGVQDPWGGGYVRMRCG